MILDIQRVIRQKNTSSCSPSQRGWFADIQWTGKTPGEEPEDPDVPDTGEFFMYEFATIYKMEYSKPAYLYELSFIDRETRDQIWKDIGEKGKVEWKREDWLSNTWQYQDPECDQGFLAFGQQTVKTKYSEFIGTETGQSSSAVWEREGEQNDAIRNNSSGYKYGCWIYDEDYFFGTYSYANAQEFLANYNTTLSGSRQYYAGGTGKNKLFKVYRQNPCSGGELFWENPSSDGGDEGSPSQTKTWNENGTALGQQSPHGSWQRTGKKEVTYFSPDGTAELTKKVSPTGKPADITTYEIKSIQAYFCGCSPNEADCGDCCVNCCFLGDEVRREVGLKFGITDE